MTPRTVGRDAELALLHRALAAAAAGPDDEPDTAPELPPAPRVVALTGEPGVGRSHLLAALAAAADERGAAVLRGRAAEWEDALPYGVFVDALDACAGGLAAARLPAAHAAALATILPSAAALAPSGAAPGAGERHRAHRAVRALLEALARERPVVVILDDVHWADPASVDLLVALLDRPAGPGVLVAWAARTSGVAPALRAALARAVREDRAAALDLGPLDRAAAGELLGTAVDAATADDLYRRSAGNPFDLEELARTGAAVPAAVAAALARELDALAPDVRTVLEAAAVAGEPFEPDLVADVADLGEDDVLVALDSLAARGLIRATDVPRRFVFRRPLVRHAVYEAAGAGWRIAAHARAAAALTARRASPSARARHAEHAARHGDEAAIALFEEAARDCAGRAPATAARWSAAALRLLPVHPRTAARRLDLLEGRAHALAAAGRLAESRTTLVAAIELAAQAAPERRTGLEIARARVEQWEGRASEARRRLLAAREALADTGGADAAHLALLLAVDGLHELDFGRTRALGTEALELAGRAGDGALGAEALAVLAAGDAAVGRLTAARAHADQAAVLVDALDDAALGPHVEAFHFLAWAETMLERFAPALRHIERGLAASRTTGARRAVVPLLLGRVEPHLGLGDLVRAREAAQEAVEAGRLSGRAQELSWALWTRAYAELHAGDVHDAVRLAEEAVDAARGLEANVLAGADPGWTLGEALVEAGEADRGHDVLLDAVGGPDAPRVAPVDRPIAWERLALAALARDHVAAARAYARRARAAAARLDGLDAPAAAAARALAAVLVAEGHAPDAVDVLEAALDRVTGAARLEPARLRLALGRALAAAGTDRPGAIAVLAAAEADLASLGAEHWRAQAARELRRLGHRVATRPRVRDDGVEGLTERELTVARLVHDRHTNKEIARRLYLSEKTVEAHLRNIFAKFRVSSRVAVAREIERLGAAGAAAGATPA